MYRSFDALAAEILIAIAELLPRDGQNNLAKTCRVLRDMCDPILYRTAIQEQKFDDEDSSLVLRAAKEGNIDTLRKAVGYGANIDGPPPGRVSRIILAGGYRVLTTLHVAILADQYDVIDYLLQNGADVYAEILDNVQRVKLISPIRETEATEATAAADPSEWYGIPDGDLNPKFPDYEGATPCDVQWWSPGPPYLAYRLPRRDSFDAYDLYDYRKKSIHFPLLDALEKAVRQLKPRAAEMLIRHGACWLRPRRTALAYDPAPPLDSAGFKVTVELLRLLDRAEKLHSRQVGRLLASNTDDDELVMLRLLCDYSKGLYHNRKKAPLAYAALIGSANLADIAIRRCGNSVDDDELFLDHDALHLAVWSNDVATAEVVFSHTRNMWPVSIDVLCLAVEN